MASMDLRDFIAGWIGGAAGVISSHPLDTVKVRLQTMDSYKGTVDCTIKTLQKEGVTGFFKGMSFPLLSVAAYNALVFGIYSNVTRHICRTRYNDDNHSASYLDMTIASMVTGAASVSIGAPVDLVKIRLQAQTGLESNSATARSVLKQRSNGLLRPQPTPTYLISTTVSTAINTTTSKPVQYRGVIDCLVQIYKENGVRGFYKGGAPAMVLRDVPGYVNYFLPYAILCKAFSNHETGETGPLGLIIAGGLAGVWSWGIMHPVDTVKSRIQLEGHKYKGVIDCVRTMYRDEGARVFLRGIGVNALRGFPQSAALFFGYEMSMRAMSSSN